MAFSKHNTMTAHITQTQHSARSWEVWGGIFGSGNIQMPALVKGLTNLRGSAEVIYSLNISHWPTFLVRCSYSIRSFKMSSLAGPKSKHPVSPNISITACKYGTLPIYKWAPFLFWLSPPHTAIIIRIRLHLILIIQYPPPPPPFNVEAFSWQHPPLSSFLQHHCQVFRPPPPPHPPPPTPLTFSLRDSEGSLRAEVRHDHRQHHHHPAVWPHRRRVRSSTTIRATLPTVGVLLSPVLPPRSVPSPGSRCLGLSFSPSSSPPNNKERLLAFLVVLSPPPPPALIRN